MTVDGSRLKNQIKKVAARQDAAATVIKVVNVNAGMGFSKYFPQSDR